MSEDPKLAVKDHGNTSGQGHSESSEKQKWEEQQAVYIGLRYPEDRKKRKHKRSKIKDKDKEGQEEQADVTNKIVTPPSQRVACILGRDEDDEDEEHQPHDLFCELGELRPLGDDGEMHWKETARWIKFEEDVEEGGERWSKPHVATLSLHSLFELRKGLLTGTVILDMDASDIVQITDLLVENMAASGQLDFDNKEKLTEVLLTKHRHQHQQKEGKGLPMIRSLADIGRKMSARNLEQKTDSNPSFAAFGNDHKTTDSKASMGTSLAVPGGSAKDLHGDASAGNSSADLSDPHKYNQHFLKKIPAGAEAANILVGEVDFLPAPVIAFIRLRTACVLGDITEVPVPTRFLFMLLGPMGERQKYHEIGRSIGTLMSDEIFHDVAYKARDCDELLAAFDEFLDFVTVLPPGEWDPTIRIEPPKNVPSQEKRKKPSFTNTGSIGMGAGGDPGKPGLPNGKAASPVPAESEEQHGDPTLIMTGRFCGGLINDIKRKAHFYLSDFTDALHVQSIAAIFFMYFACLTPIVTFGGLLGAATGNYIAAMESLVSGAVCGITFHLFGGQPLTIIGSTGPVLIFESIVYKFCVSNGWYYLEFRFWIGMWMCIWLLCMVVFDLSSLVRFITRFTEESFAMLIAIIFIYEAFKKLFEGLKYYPVNLHPELPLNYNCTCFPPNITDATTTITGLFNNESGYGMTVPNIDWDKLTGKQCDKLKGIKVGEGCDTPHYKPDIFFFTCLLFIGTFALSMSLKMFRNTRFFPNKVRIMVSDFAVFLAICTMVFVDFMMGLKTKKLEVPESIRPTNDDRGWIVNPFKFRNPWYNIAAGLPPSLLATILIFMDQQITAVIVNRKEHKLKKGGGYHLDLLIVTMQIFTCTIIGTPWFVAATVLSINHVRSLTIESEAAAPGESAKFLGIREQRVTGTIVFILVGVSALLADVLKFIPMAVLYGVFLYMGISSLRGIQFVQRVLVMFMPAKYQPDYMFLRNVRLRRVHLFTFIQLLCLTGLCVIKEIDAISIVFPLMVLAMCFIRKGLDSVFTQHELKWLDDIMPEAHKREKEKHKKSIANGDGPDGDEEELGNKAIMPPVYESKAPTAPAGMNISEEMAKTSIWRQLSGGDDKQLRSRKGNNADFDMEKGKSNPPVKFQIADEDDDENELLMKPPQICIDSPTSNKGGIPTNV